MAAISFASRSGRMSSRLNSTPEFSPFAGRHFGGGVSAEREGLRGRCVEDDGTVTGLTRGAREAEEWAMEVAQWLVRLETETQNISQESHYHGDYYYRTVVLDGLPQGEKTCFSLTGGEILVDPEQHNVSEVEFELDSDPAGTAPVPPRQPPSMCPPTPHGRGWARPASIRRCASSSDSLNAYSTVSAH
jgi:hypothetical protein